MNKIHRNGIIQGASIKSKRKGFTQGGNMNQIRKHYTDISIKSTETAVYSVPVKIQEKGHYTGWVFEKNKEKRHYTISI
jgi:hypothetical protein